MRVLVITSCTATKLSHPAIAEKLYQGQQHLRIMAGVTAARRDGDQVDVVVFSALHGPVPGGEIIEPYDLTFATMPAVDRNARKGWMGFRLRALVNCPGRYDRAIIALGVDYVDGTGLDTCTLCQPTVRLVASRQSTMRPLDIVVPAGLPETSRFGAGLAALKGEMVRRLLTRGVHRREREFFGLAYDLTPLGAA